MQEELPSQTTDLLKKGIPLDVPFGLLLNRGIFFRGTSNNDQRLIFTSEETTIGDGLYLTSDKEIGACYARERAKCRTPANPCISAFEYQDLKLAVLLTQESVEFYIPVFIKEFEKYVRGIPEDNRTWLRQGIALKMREAYEKKQVHPGSLKYVAASCGAQFSIFFKQKGFDGIITMEGGEGDWARGHDSIVIFNPQHNLVGVTTTPLELPQGPIF